MLTFAPTEGLTTQKHCKKKVREPAAKVLFDSEGNLCDG